MYVPLPISSKPSLPISTSDPAAIFTLPEILIRAPSASRRYSFPSVGQNEKPRSSWPPLEISNLLAVPNVRWHRVATTGMGTYCRVEHLAHERAVFHTVAGVNATLCRARRSATLRSSIPVMDLQVCKDCLSTGEFTDNVPR